MQKIENVPIWTLLNSAADIRKASRTKAESAQSQPQPRRAAGFPASRQASMPATALRTSWTANSMAVAAAPTTTSSFNGQTMKEKSPGTPATSFSAQASANPGHTPAVTTAKTTAPTRPNAARNTRPANGRRKSSQSSSISARVNRPACRVLASCPAGTPLASMDLTHSPATLGMDWAQFFRSASGSVLTIAPCLVIRPRNFSAFFATIPPWTRAYSLPRSVKMSRI